jgi:hypothetical protein
MENARALAVPPPGAGVYTETFAVPTAAISAAPIAAFIVVLPTKVVTRSAPFQRTIEAGTNPEPLTTRVNADPPKVAAEGESEVIDGKPYWIGTEIAVAAPPPGAGFTAPICAAPTLPTSAARIVVCN